MAGWYVRRGDKVIGPIEVDQLKESVAAGKLLPTDQLAKDAAGPWTEASKTKLFAAEPQPRTAIAPQGERLPVAVAQQSEPPQNKFAPVVRTGQVIVSKVAGGTVATWNAIARTLSVRAQRKHEIKLAKIQAKAMAEANRPPAPHQPEHPRPAPQQPPPQPVTIVPQIVQTTVVKVVNKNTNGGCGCSGCGVLLLIVLLAIIAAAIYNGSQPTP
jgi:hypothetical protein